ncbi:hypothetical protein AB0904_03725 [Streptomyces sp. NPDC006684]|uniref:hypothetical protein n=1 Tax=Streptomyces sp. NPDC006684 TaxID=3154477 RepID=UPI003451AC38
MAQESGSRRMGAAPPGGRPARTGRALARTARAALLAERPYESLDPRARTEARRVQAALGTLTRPGGPSGPPEPPAELLAVFRAGAARDARGAEAPAGTRFGARRARLLAAGVLSLGMVGGVAVAGGTGALTSFPSFPRTVQPRDPGPAPDDSGTSEGAVPGATSSPDPARELLAPSGQPSGVSPSPSPSGTRSGPAATGTAASGTANACRAHLRGHVVRATERRLAALAGGTGRIEAYCASLLRGGTHVPGPSLSVPAPAAPSLTLPGLPGLPTTYPTYGFEEPTGSPSPSPTPSATEEPDGSGTPTWGPHETSPAPPTDAPSTPPDTSETPAPADSPAPSAPPTGDLRDQP